MLTIREIEKIRFISHKNKIPNSLLEEALVTFDKYKISLKIKILANIFHYIKLIESIDLSTNGVQMGATELARQSGCNERQIAKYIRALEEEGWISVNRTDKPYTYKTVKE